MPSGIPQQTAIISGFSRRHSIPNKKLSHANAAELPLFSDQRLLVVFVGSHGGLLEFVAGLVEQLLGMLRVAIHIKLIGLLGSLDLFKGLVAKTLRRSQVWMSFPTDVF